MPHPNYPNAYAYAAAVIKKLLLHQGSLDTQLNTVFTRAPNKLQPKIKALCYETMRYYPQAELMASQLISKKLKSCDQDIYALILIGLCALEQQKNPDFAIINDIVNAAKQLNKQWAAGFINGVLRQYLRQQTAIKTHYHKSASFQLMQPTWLIDLISASYGAQAEAILTSLNAHAPMVLRVNLQKIDRPSYLAQLKQQEMEAWPGEVSPAAVYLAAPLPVDKLPGFNEGLVSIQDEAAQLAAEYLDLQPDHHVLDACAAPGGKACHILEKQPGIQLDCLELETKRAEKIQQNLTRLGLSANIQIGDAMQQTWWNKKLYDRILLDAPCSGTGIIRRQPDIKLLRSLEDINKLKAQQIQMLNNLWQMLKPGGKLLYSTCSILPQENEQVIQHFISQIGQTHHARLALSQQLLPQADGYDGFYYARLEK